MILIEESNAEGLPLKPSAVPELRMARVGETIGAEWSKGNAAQALRTSTFISSTLQTSLYNFPLQQFYRYVHVYFSCAGM